LICEAAGYNVVLIETIGVGQSEIAVRSMVDFFLLVMIAGAGDELQGLKKGVMELADALVVNKADSRNKANALRAKNEYAMALKYLAPATKGWETNAYTCSGLTGEGVPEIWETIKAFEQRTKQTGVFNERRQRQSIDWVFSMIEDYLKENFYSNPSVQKELPDIKEKLLKGDLLPTAAAERLLAAYYLSEK
jgi:LAO/AO transport system kinase